MATDANDNSGSSLAMTTNTESSSTDPSTSAQLEKLRRFLSTLFYFGSDISSDIGERVRALIFAIVNNALSIEEFHGKLQATTNFPLRPFALPFLKSTLPLLHKELLQLSRQSKQSINQYLVQHEDFLFLARDSLENELHSSSKEQFNENGKRSLPEENNLEEISKRSRIGNHSLPKRDKERTFSSYLQEYPIDDHWKNAENMLNCTVEMVTKSKRIFFALQQKDLHLRRLIETTDFEWRRRHAELLTQTDERIAEVRRKAEETVLEIKRQSIIDLQKAICQSEQKSNEILLREREQFQRLKSQTYEEIYSVFNRQEDGLENCWHCGRKAIETCSNCNFARYCGPYCQHRDWDAHQEICNSDLKSRYQENPQRYPRRTRKTSSFSLSRTNSSSPPQMTADQLTAIKSETT